MPINLPLEAQRAWDDYLEATTTTEKIACLEDFLSKCPHHKGVEKFLANAKTKLSKLKAQQEAETHPRDHRGKYRFLLEETDGKQTHFRNSGLRRSRPT